MTLNLKIPIYFKYELLCTIRCRWLMKGGKWSGFQSQVQGFQEVFRVSKQKNYGQYFILSLKHIRL